MTSVTMEKLFDAVINQDTEGLLSLFADGEANLSLPSFGTISNNRIFAMLVKKLERRFTYLGVTSRHERICVSGSRQVSEYTLSYLFHDEEHHKEVTYATPTALVCDLNADGKITFMNVYTGFDAFVGKEIVRPAMYNAKAALWDEMPASVRADYEAKQVDRRCEPCRVFRAGNCVYVEENVLFTLGEICTPQAHLSVFTLDEQDGVSDKKEYGEIVWEFKLWPTLY